MKILFVVIDSRTLRYGIMALSAFLKSKSLHQVFLEEYTDLNRLENRFNEISPHFVAYTCMSGEYGQARQINRYLKGKGKQFVSLWGGPHPTYSPEIINDEGVDAICVGEGEEAILELCDKWQNGNRQYNISNWIFKVNGQIIENPVRPLMDLDTLPIPDFNIFKSPKREYIKILVSRGCYFNCTYCFNHKWKQLYNNFGKPVRTMSVGRSMEVLKYVKNEFGNRIKFVYFEDDIFPLKDETWIMEFCNKYIKYIKIPFYINLYPTMVHEKSIALLKKAGLFRVNFAIESGNEYIRSDVLKRRMSNDRILETAAILHKYNLFISTQNITCLPREDFKRAKDTFELNIKCRPHIAVISKFAPFPKTELTELAIKDGYLKRGEFENKISHDFHWVSLLNFREKKEKAKMEYMVNLFTLGVTFPFLKPLIYILAQAPQWPLIKRFYANIDNQAWSMITQQDFNQMMRILSKKNEKVRLFLKIMLRIILAKKKTKQGGG